jgi:hypothetical protein
MVPVSPPQDGSGVHPPVPEPVRLTKPRSAHPGGMTAQVAGGRAQRHHRSRGTRDEGLRMGFPPGTGDPPPPSQLDRPPQTPRPPVYPLPIVNILRTSPKSGPRPAFPPGFEPQFRSLVRKCRSVTSSLLKHLFTLFARPDPRPKHHNALPLSTLKSYETVSHDLCTSYSQVSARTMPKFQTLSNRRIERHRCREPIVNKPRNSPASPLNGRTGKGRIRRAGRSRRSESAGSPR